MPLTPRVEEAIARLAKMTAEKGWDPGKVIVMLLEMSGKIGALPPDQRAAVLRELRRMRDAD